MAMQPFIHDDCLAQYHRKALPLHMSTQAYSHYHSISLLQQHMLGAPNQPCSIHVLTLFMDVSSRQQRSEPEDSHVDLATLIRNVYRERKRGVIRIVTLCLFPPLPSFFSSKHVI